MAKKGVIGIILMIIIGFSLVIIIPISSISLIFSSYRCIEENFSYDFEPSSPSPIEQLYIIADVGNIDIKYVYYNVYPILSIIIR